MTLVLDTSVLYAALDRRDPDHEPCRELLESSEETLIVPSPVLPELDYFVGEQLGAQAMIAFLRDVRAGAYVVQELKSEDYARAIEILDRYADLKVGFVDAAVLAIVERFGETRLATLDHRHFSVLRPRHVKSLELVP